MASGELVFGRRAVAALLQRDPTGILEVWTLEQRASGALSDTLEAAGAAGISVHTAPRRTLDSLVDGGRHQGVVARYRGNKLTGHGAPTATDLAGLIEGLAEPALLLVLEHVQDPHNLGACLRSADAAGAHAVIVPRRRSAGLNPTVRKVASGAAEYVPLMVVGNVATTIATMQRLGITVVGTVADGGESLYDVDLSGPVALVLGSEEVGLQRLVRERCDHVARIPLHGRVQSLNVSVAAGVCLFEAVRQRMTNRA